MEAIDASNAKEMERYQRDLAKNLKKVKKVIYLKPLHQLSISITAEPQSTTWGHYPKS